MIQEPEEKDAWRKRQGMNKAMELAIKQELKKERKTKEELVPEEFHDFMHVFSDKAAAHFPERKPWDHVIKLKEGFQPKSPHIYPLSPEEENELQKFINKNLEKGYIRPSKSPQAAPFFYVPKKNGKIRPVQDYQYLNT